MEDLRTVEAVASVLRPLINNLEDKVTAVEEKVQSQRAFYDEGQKSILATLHRIEEQTKKTNGRVSELEKREILNKVARGALVTIACVILLSVLNAVLKTVNLSS